ncbi:MAG: hypothetical protein K9H64_01965 [Bacteroidales bacterium]|nr:hypothetical protein [Bacteroidales bacterium]MCF8454688.1 hypothetical protein [Bacteroidales bacterium]
MRNLIFTFLTFLTFSTVVFARQSEQVATGDVNQVKSVSSTTTVPPGWFFSNTGNNHVILIPSGIPLTINGIQISVGDYIGVFYDSLGTLACAGYINWQGVTNAITVWGAQSGLIDGMATGEEFKWKIFDVSEGIEYNAVAIYDTQTFQQPSIYQANGLSGILSLAAYMNAPQWDFINTGDLHIILITFNTPVTIDSIPIAIGDYVGVFYDSLGTLVCAGYEEWTGQNIAVTIWGDDVLTSSPDGFILGEPFKWKIWRASNNTVFSATATYMSQPSFPNSGTYTSNGISSIASLEAFTIEYQYIDLPLGWSLFSTYIEPFEPAIDSLCNPFYSSVIIVKDENGNTLWPQYGINTIGDVMTGEAYRIKLSLSQTMIVTGLSVQPEITQLVLPQGWSFLGYLRKNSAPIPALLSPLSSELIIAVNGAGEIYWPQWQINTIGNMNPGEGYQVKMVTQQFFAYPPN